jgi:hypothetical protein
MQKPRPKEAPAPRQQRPTRETGGSTKGASAPFVIPEGEKVPETPAKPTDTPALPKADHVVAKPAGTDPAVIVFGYTERRLPQASWFPEAEADLARQAARLMGLRVLRIENEAHREVATRLRQGQVYAADQAFAPIALPDIFSRLCELAGPAGARSPDNGDAASRPASWQAIAVGDLVIAHESAEDGWWEAIVVAVENDQLLLRWRDYPRQPCVRRGRFEVALLPPIAA